MKIILTKQEVLTAIIRYVAEDIFEGNIHENTLTVYNDFDIDGEITVIKKDEENDTVDKRN